MRPLLLMVALFMSLCGLPAQAVIETYEFKSPELEERYRRFTQELRCPKCQNQNLSGSNSPIAEDLRRELHRLLQEGKTDDEIVQYMVDRYGEFVLYRPRLNTETAMLWLAPAIFLLVGAVVLIVIVRRQRGRTALPADDVALSEQERKTLDRLLKEKQE